jgi:uncharacterized membrane protein YgdD (TMEM256/DUF423 family)
MDRERFILLAAGILGAWGVAMGALGAHALKSRLDSAMLAAYQTGVLYHMLHAVALLGCVALVGRTPQLVTGAAAAFTVGVLMFSGSLYALALGGPRWLGPITPLGGLTLIVGWGLLGVCALTR